MDHGARHGADGLQVKRIPVITSFRPGNETEVEDERVRWHPTRWDNGRYYHESHGNPHACVLIPSLMWWRWSTRYVGCLPDIHVCHPVDNPEKQHNFDEVTLWWLAGMNPGVSIYMDLVDLVCRWSGLRHHRYRFPWTTWLTQICNIRLKILSRGLEGHSHSWQHLIAS